MIKIKDLVLNVVPKLSQPRTAIFAVITIIMMANISGLYSSIKPEDLLFKIYLQVMALLFGLILLTLVSGTIHLILSIKNIHLQSTYQLFALIFVSYIASLIVHFGIMNEIAHISLIFICLGWILGVYAHFQQKNQ